MLPTVETKPVVLKLSLTFEEELTETDILDISRALVNGVATETGIDAADVTCEGPTSIDTSSLTFDYEVTLTVAIPKADGDVSMEVAAALTASIELLPELQGASIALVSITDGEKDAVYVTPSPTVETKPVVLKLSLSFSEVLTETEIFDIARAMVNGVAAEAGIDAADVTCEGPTSIDTSSLTFDYEVTLTLAIPKADGDVSMEVAAALTASIELLPELEGASIALTSFTDGEKDAVYVTPSPTVKTKPVVLKLSVSLEEALTETEITDTCSAMVNDVSAEAGIDAAGVMCEMTAYNVATFDYNVVITLAIPEANGDVAVDVAEALVTSIELLPELEGASVALTSITDGKKDAVYITLSSSAAKAALSLCAALCALAIAC